jgi:hypothetical protein
VRSSRVSLTAIHTRTQRPHSRTHNARSRAGPLPETVLAPPLRTSAHEHGGCRRVDAADRHVARGVRVVIQWRARANFWSGERGSVSREIESTDDQHARHHDIGADANGMPAPVAGAGNRAGPIDGHGGDGHDQEGREHQDEQRRSQKPARTILGPRPVGRRRAHQAGDGGTEACADGNEQGDSEYGGLQNMESIPSRCSIIAPPTTP